MRVTSFAPRGFPAHREREGAALTITIPSSPRSDASGGRVSQIIVVSIALAAMALMTVATMALTSHRLGSTFQPHQAAVVSEAPVVESPARHQSAVVSLRFDSDLGQVSVSSVSVDQPSFAPLAAEAADAALSDREALRQSSTDNARAGTFQ
jgi:hypothetical protein